MNSRRLYLHRSCATFALRVNGLAVCTDFLAISKTVRMENGMIRRGPRHDLIGKGFGWAIGVFCDGDYIVASSAAGQLMAEPFDQIERA